ncbi:hypothetical protein HYC85_029373 [Camellia sinensis]|uniref:FATC domain-containing protein n=1 Tax=Camellia sinensis TaxID=4442 RepID=A0A7J7FXW3_CAMSI|nr:hypothetical protein HYC85_029373 [Camellia sinensis]
MTRQGWDSQQEGATRPRGLLEETNEVGQPATAIDKARAASSRPQQRAIGPRSPLAVADWVEERGSSTLHSGVGYIVGLGDRHSMNIIIDQATAEVVHIDLGVAFEQGLMLKTPERVFIHDPLYKWALSPLKALQLQKLKYEVKKLETDDYLETSLEDSQEEYEGNKDAARALMRVKQKLDGYEEGEMRSMHGQVQQLIQDAIDPDRLCQMFPGWGAWL